jgi:UDP-N-acetyl-D-mannosaminuronic acid dehydrogenase
MILVGNQLQEELQLYNNDIHSPQKILIIGLGQIGYSNAKYMISKGLWVEGYDISQHAIKRALTDGVIKKAAVNFADYDYYIICISTHQQENMFMPDLRGIYEVAYQISKQGKSGALIGIDSTIPRGTSQRIEQILEHRLHVVHVPHRFYINEQKEHGVNQIRVMGSCKSCCQEKAKHFYGKLLGIPVFPVSSPDIAELTKIVENSYRYVEIAFAEELKIICDKINVDFNELRSAVNTKWNANILEAQQGIGGHCLPKDSQMLLDISKDVVHSSVIEAAKKIDHQYRIHNEKLSQNQLTINMNR